MHSIKTFIKRFSDEYENQTLDVSTWRGEDTDYEGFATFILSKNTNQDLITIIERILSDFRNEDEEERLGFTREVLNN